jgi:hypothetical protein
MRHLKTVLICILVSAVLLSVFACGKESPNNTSAESNASAVSENGTSDNSAEASGTDSSEEVSEYQPVVRYLGGTEIKFLVPGSTYSYYESFEIYAEELNTEIINDAVYDRNQMVQDKYNCTIAADKSSNVANDMRTNIASDIDTYDVYMPMINEAVKMDKGLMLDLNTLTDLNLKESWWDQKANDGLEINGKLYFSTGDISVLDNDCTMVMFFNKKLANQYNVGDLYKMVREKQWTLDKVYEISRGFTQNIGDDTVWDNNDNYGLHVAFNAPHSFYFGCGGTIAEKDSEGGLKISITSEKNQTILSEVFDISYKPDVLTNKLPGCDSFESICAMFLNNQVMFTTFALIDIKSFRNADGFDFGILPYPLYNSDQEEYHCLVSTSMIPCICIPSNCDNPEDTALAVEAMAYYSVDTLTKAYYVKTLKGRDLVDEDSEEMLDIIFSSRVYDLGYIYNFGGVGGLIEKMNNASSSDFTSNYEAIEGMVESDLQATLEKFE